MNKSTLLFCKFSIIIMLLCGCYSLLTGCHSVKFNPKTFSFVPNDSTMVKQGKANFLAQHYDRAFKQLMVPAKHGNPEAQYAIGYMYYYGKGVKQDKPLGTTWINKSAKQGNKQAIASLKILEQNNITN